MHLLLSALIGGLAFRLRGSDLVHRTPIPMEGRLIWSAAMALLAFWLSAWDARLLLLAPAFFIGACPGWFQTLDLGRDRVQADRLFLRAATWANEAAWMAARGLIWTGPPGIVLALVGYDWTFGFAGLLCPVLYEIAWRVPSRITGLHRGPELGELLFGLWLGAALYLSMGA